MQVKKQIRDLVQGCRGNAGKVVGKEPISWVKHSHQSSSAQDSDDFAGAVGPGGGLSMGAAALGDEAGSLIQSVAAKSDEFLGGVGAVNYIGEGLHLIRP